MCTTDLISYYNRQWTDLKNKKTLNQFKTIAYISLSVMSWNGSFSQRCDKTLPARTELFFSLSPFQLQITASVRERPLQATWATISGRSQTDAVICS